MLSGGPVMVEGGMCAIRRTCDGDDVNRCCHANRSSGSTVVV